MSLTIGSKGSAAAVLLLMIAGFLCGNARGTEETGEKKVIDRVIAIVEDKAVLQSEFEIEYKRLLLQIGDTENITAERKREIRKEVLEGLVADLLMAVHAERIGIEVEQESIDAQVQEAIERNKREIGGEEAFKRELKKNGITVQQLRMQWREKIKSRQLIQKLMYREVMGQINIKEEELREYYRENIQGTSMRPATVKLAQILILPEPSGKSKEIALEKIREIEKRLKNGEAFSGLAEKYSEGPSAKYGGNLGFLKLDELNNPDFVEAVRKLEVGEVSPPVLTDFGYHLIKLDEIDGEEKKIRHILVKLKESTGEKEEALKKAKEIRKRILDGKDFGKLASQFSDDKKTAEKGGVIGEIPLAKLPDFFKEAIKNVKPGELAPVVKDSKGFRIIKVLGREKERPYSFKEAEDDLRNLLRQEKMQKNYIDYVDTLKSKYYVDIKEDVQQ
ncbi:MAG TPA: peptidylprolyl isomerase [Candidatus Krumholzibacteriaceae bacterium]|nr:peptidylprolyl isomerase [Candidatus Krumholzibacteriaceae bacterium]